MTDTTQTSAAFAGDYNHTYAFYYVATDSPGNSQALPTQAQTSTNVTPLVTMTGVSVISKKGQPDRQQPERPSVDAEEADSTTTATVIKLKSAAFNTANDKIALTLKKPLKIAKSVLLLIHGQVPSGLDDSFGR